MMLTVIGKYVDHRTFDGVTYVKIGSSAYDFVGRHRVEFNVYATVNPFMLDRVLKGKAYRQTFVLTDCIPVVRSLGSGEAGDGVPTIVGRCLHIL